VSSGNTVVVMDSDLQDPPELIPTLYEKYREGFDVVYAQRRKRDGETWFKRITAGLFYRIIRRMTTIDIPVDTGDFRLMSRRVVDDLKRLQEQSRFVRGLVTWVGYNQTPVLYRFFEPAPAARVACRAAVRRRQPAAHGGADRLQDFGWTGVDSRLDVAGSRRAVSWQSAVAGNRDSR
jgi:glycosyltransferase involved in cell wall biosynthesis